MVNLFNWDELFKIIDNSADFQQTNAYLEELLIPYLQDDFFELFLRELNIQTHYMDNTQKQIWITYKYLKALLVKDIENFSKDIDLNKLKNNLLINKNNKELSIKHSSKYSSSEKDILLEDLEKKYNIELQILKNTYIEKYNLWAKENISEIREYALIKEKIEAWFKFSSILSS